MFSTSSQLNFWIFNSLEEINNNKNIANSEFIKSNSNKLKEDLFLSIEEEEIIRKYYESQLIEFCLNFNPSMPKYVMGTSIAYFKRLYIHSSVMENDPKTFLYTCVYLACKVEEFNLSISQFVMNIKNGNEETVDTILSTELQLMSKLQYHLTVHNPFRPIEGFLIDIKVRCADIPNAEQLRPNIEKFLDKSLLTDAVLLFPPSQIALSAIVASSAAMGLNAAIDRYIANKLCETASHAVLQKILKQIKKIRHMVQKSGTVDFENVSHICNKLDQIHVMTKRNSASFEADDIFIKSESLDSEDPDVKKIKIEPC